jgi:hypothetical protein
VLRCCSFVYRLVIYVTQVFMEQHVLLSKSPFSSNDAMLLFSHFLAVLTCRPILIDVGSYVDVAALAK